MTVRDDARAAFKRIPVTVIEMDFEACTLTYGVGACTASGGSGNECYNTRPTCQDLTNYTAGTKTLKICNRACPVPVGENLFPWLQKLSARSAVLKPEGGLSARARVTMNLIDEVITDTWADPYIANRAAPAGGSFWRRFLARNRAVAGKTVRVRRGFAVTPWDWDVFLTELYTIDTIKGPTAAGHVTVVVKDPSKLVDNVQLPAPSKAKLVYALPAYDDAGTAQGGSINTIVLRADAEPLDDFYNGMAVRIDENQGAGQERVITDYEGVSRTATVSPAFAVAPDANSNYVVQQLSITLDGHGADYDAYGVPGLVRIGKELINFTGRAGDVLSWPSTDYRQQYDTPLEDHNEGAAVQLCKAFADEAYTDVLKWFFTASGLSSSLIDSATWAALDTTWLGLTYRITMPLSTPKKASAHIDELLETVNGMVWWDPQDQLLKFLPNAPSALGAVATLTDETGLIAGSIGTERLNDLRLTQAALYFRREHGTADVNNPSTFLRGEVHVDADAENEYNDVRSQIMYSRFFGAANASAAKEVVARNVLNHRDAPLEITVAIDPKDYDFKRGDQIDIATDQVIDAAGQRSTVRALVTRLDDMGERVNLVARTTIFTRRFAFFAPNTTNDYPNNGGYACFCLNTGLMADGSEGYLFY